MAPRDLRRVTRLAGALAVPAAGVLLAACSSPTPSATRPARHPHGTSPTSHRTTTTTTTTTPAPTTTPPVSGSTATAPRRPTTVAGLLACSSGSLSLREGALSAAAGTSHVTYLLTNEGAQRCRLRGYPTVTFFGTSGAGGGGAGSPLGVRPIELGGTDGPVTVRAGGSATFMLSVAEVPVDGAACQQAGSLRVTPPGNGAALSVPASFTICGPTVGVYPLSVGQ